MTAKINYVPNVGNHPKRYTPSVIDVVGQNTLGDSYHEPRGGIGFVPHIYMPL